MSDPALLCPAVSEGIPCVKPLYLSQSGEAWEHAGGHVYSSSETLQRIQTWHFDAADFLAGKSTAAHAPEDCPGEEFCSTARYGER